MAAVALEEHLLQLPYTAINMFTEEEKLKTINDHLSTLSCGPYVEDISSLPRPPPVRTELTTDVGRQLVASRDIIAGEVLFTEAPFIPAIPRPDTMPVCLSCLTILPEKFYNCCSRCGVPLCSDACEANRHSREECCLLAKMGWQSREETPISLQELNLLITPLRALLYLNAHPEIVKVVWSLADGAESRAKFNPAAHERQKKVAAIIKSKLCWNLEDVEEKVIKIMGIYDTNGFDVPFDSEYEGQESWGRAVFPGTSMMNHSCVPNTHNTFTATDKSMLIWASLNIPKGTPICINYSKTKVMWGNRMRREYLKYKWFFTCNCARCTDPTELGSYISSAKCKRCNGMIVPPNDGYNTPWTCNTCQKTVSAQAVDAALTLSGMSFAKVSKNNVKALRCAAIVADKIFGPQIFLTVAFKHQIVKVIMKKHTEECSLSELWCVVDMTRSLLDVADRLAPGMSYLRGDMLYKHIRAALEILLRAKNDKTETVSTINDCNNLNGNIDDKQELSISDNDTIDADGTAKDASRNDYNKLNGNIDDKQELSISDGGTAKNASDYEPSEVGSNSISLLPTDNKSLNYGDRLKFRWKELDVKVLLKWTKETQEIMKYTSFFARVILQDTDDAIEAFQELLQS